MTQQKVFALVKLHLKKLIREPANLFMMILFPAMLTFIFGLSFGTADSGIPGISQFEVMVPGLFAYACIFMIMTVSQSFTDDREQGLLRRINMTSTNPKMFMSSHLISNTLTAIFQVVIVAVLAFLMGYRPSGGIGGISLAFAFIILLSICSVGLGLITASIAKNAGSATGISFIFIMPQMFFGTFIPLTNDATRVISLFLPSSYVTDSLTSIFNGTSLTDISLWVNLGVVSIISVVIIIIGILLFKKYGNNQ